MVAWIPVGYCNRPNWMRALRTEWRGHVAAFTHQFSSASVTRALLAFSVRFISRLKLPRHSVTIIVNGM